MDVNLNTWFDVNAEEAQDVAKFNVSSYADNLNTFYAEGFHKLGLVSFFTNASVESITIKDCAMTSIVAGIRNIPTLASVDISNNRIDFTESSNATFYSANVSNPKYSMNHQKPDLKMSNMADVEVNAGGNEPTITPTFVYADGSDVDFSNVPDWMDADYAATYTTSITYSDTPTLDMSKEGTYTRTYTSPNGTAIGSVKIKVVAAPTTKETPTLTLTSTPSTNITTDTEVTFHATLEKSGSDDVNTDANVEFFDGTTSLGSIAMAQDKATLSNQTLTEGTHIIKAVYSGNSSFNRVEETISINVQAPPNPSKQPQSIEFDEALINKTYGDGEFQNPYSKSETASTGNIRFVSSNEAIASVEETSGKVTMHRAGSVTISLYIDEDSSYQAASASYSLTIAKREITISDLSIKDKVYDGTNHAEIAGPFKANGIVSADRENITIEVGSAEFTDALAGTQKPILLKDFTMKGEASDCYTLELPTVTATILQKEAEIIVTDVERMIGEENPSFEYTITGLVGSDTIDTIHDFIAPKFTTGANKDSVAGTYRINGSGASSKNYVFTYQSGNLTIKDKEAIPSDAYSIEGTKGKNNWYTSDVRIKPTGEFTQIWDGASWKDELTYQNGEYENICFKLRKEDGSESEEICIASLHIDTIAPVAANIKNGDTYLLNRMIHIHSEDVSMITLDGETMDFKNDIELSIKDTATHTIVLEDRAGNTTTYSYQSKTLQEYAKDLQILTLETVKYSDYDSLINFKKELDELSKTDSYTPSSEQKTQLMELQMHCEELLAVLEAPANGIVTGDTTSIVCLLLVSICSLWLCIAFCRKLE